MNASLRRFVLVACALSILASTAFAADSGGFILAQDGKPKAALVLSKEAFEYQPATGKRGAKRLAMPNPIAAEREAAETIAAYCEKISGAALPIVAGGEKLSGLLPIYVGGAAEAKWDATIKKKGGDPASFALIVEPRQVALRGLSPQGTFCAACELLEQLGVRWFAPGDWGTVIPETKTLQLKRQQTVQTPSFASRYLQGVPAEWEKMLRAGGPRFPSAHGVHLGVKADELLKTHPEYFSLIKGNRVNRQLCISNPDLLKLAIASTKEHFRAHPEADIIGMGANDGRNFCECDACRALDGGDYDPFGHCESMTDRYVWFFNQVLAGIKDEFPDKRIGFYAYAAYTRPPVKVKPDPKIVPAVAVITLCRMHGMENPVCPEKSYEKWIIEQWGKAVPQVYYRGYWFNLADPGLPFMMNRRIAAEIPLGKRLGIAGWRTECMPVWAGAGPSLYLAHKLMWDHTADPQAIVADYCEKFFGPARGPMAEYVELMDRTVTEADYHTGSIWDMALVYPKTVRAEAAKHLKEAAHLTPRDSLYAQRVAAFQRCFDFLEGFCEAMDARAVHDYERAQRGIDAMVAARDELAAAKPSLAAKKAEEYMSRFLTPSILSGHARTTGGNRLLVGLNDQWQFQIDPEKVGETLGWWDPTRPGGNWQKLRTSTESWSTQGLRYYKGLGWYRQTVDIPAAAKGQRVFLWFGGIDELAKVWVNGKVVGISPRMAFRPFELDATEAIVPGKPNVVVACIENETLHELGTGGILGPVMFYLPKAGKDAQLENAKPLGTVFPEY